MKFSRILIALLLILSIVLLPACSKNTPAAAEPEKTEAPAEEAEAPAEEAEALAEEAEEPAEEVEAPAEEAEAPAEEAEAPAEEAEAPAEEVEEPAEEAEAPAEDGAVKLQAPMIVTTCGQSPGAVMVSMVAGQAGLTASNDNNLSADTFEAGDLKTLVVTTGTSGKGMGAAGTDVDKEIDRCVALIEKAREAGLTIVCAHVEGMARRTDSSDQASIDAIMPLADLIVIVKDSDSDGLFSDYAAEHDVPIIIVDDALSLGEYME